MTVRTEVKKLQDQAREARSERAPQPGVAPQGIHPYNEGYFAGFMDALREVLEIIDYEEDGE